MTAALRREISRLWLVPLLLVSPPSLLGILWLIPSSHPWHGAWWAHCLLSRYWSLPVEAVAILGWSWDPLFHPWAKVRVGYAFYLTVGLLSVVTAKALLASSMSAVDDHLGDPGQR